MATEVPSRVLLVDDDGAVRFGVRRYLERRGLEVSEASDCAGARRLLAEPDSFAAAILDHRLPDGTGLDLLRHLASLPAPPPALLLTGHGSVETAVAAMKNGAVDFLTKPVDLPVLGRHLDEILVRDRHGGGGARGQGKGPEREAPTHHRKAAADRFHRASTGPLSRPDPFMGEGAAIGRLAERARRVAAAEGTVLLLGETGSGKGVLARWLHDHGPRRKGPFVQLNCASLSRELLASELFGFRAGAFTGAQRDKPGLVEAATGGTLFLDEICSLDPVVQPQLLTVLEEARFRRLGEVEDRTTDLRLIAAAQSDLAERFQDGRFRSDLFFRISTFPLYLPPLRERPEDLPALAVAVLRRLAGTTPEPRLSADALERLRRHDWPGNVRELRNCLERALLFSGSGEIGPEHLQLGLLGEDGSGVGSMSGSRGETLQEVQVRHMEKVLRQEGGNVAQAADRLGMPRSTLYQKIKAHGLDGSGG